MERPVISVVMRPGSRGLEVTSVQALDDSFIVAFAVGDITVSLIFADAGVAQAFGRRIAEVLR
jgi:hypothetical protein